MILPFEVTVFNEAQIPNTYVGNPLLDNRDLLTARVTDGKQQSRTIALLPGSRKSEISYLLPVMLDAAEKLTETYADATFVIPVADTIDWELLSSECENRQLNIKLLRSNDYRQIASCELAPVSYTHLTLPTIYSV